MHPIARAVAAGLAAVAPATALGQGAPPIALLAVEITAAPALLMPGTSSSTSAGRNDGRELISRCATMPSEAAVASLITATDVRGFDGTAVRNAANEPFWGARPRSNDAALPHPFAQPKPEARRRLAPPGADSVACPLMDRIERFYRIDQLLQERRHVPVKVFLESLDVSLATFKRDLEYMRDRLNAPIEWDREQRGYRYVQAATGMPRYQLPGLWFNPSEVHALLTMRQLLKGLDPGVLAPHVEPLLARLRGLLERDDTSADEIERRIRIIPIAARRMTLAFFEVAATATLARKRLAIAYFSRTANASTEREVSPQRLVFYRGNWYLDAWCHLRNDLRSFAIDSVRTATLLETAADDVAEADLDAHLASGYGIFSGRRTTWATIRFSPIAARWVAAETWHPLQRSRAEGDGSYVLEVPYSDPTELAMDILRHGADAEVLAPPELRTEIERRLAAALARYAVPARVA